MRIRPCIDIHDGHVKQIVGGSICDGKKKVSENFVSFENASHYADIYRQKGLAGGHIILLNSKDSEALRYEADRMQAIGALRAYPGGMQIGGGMNPENSGEYLDAGASHVIVTGYCFRNGRLDEQRLHAMQSAVGKDHLVLDLSCRRRHEDGQYVVVTDRWQKLTDMVICPETLSELSTECDEFLIHAADVEGKMNGIEKDIVSILGNWLESYMSDGAPCFPVTYAGGVHSLEDIEIIKKAASGKLDVTVGSAFDLFGGKLTLDELAGVAGNGRKIR